MVGLGALATCCQGKYVIEAKPGYIEPLNLYTSIYARPGERKSAVMRWMLQDIEQYKLICDCIIRNDFRGGKRHELHALCRSRILPTAKDMQPALELLEEHGYIRMDRGNYN